LLAHSHALTGTKEQRRDAPIESVDRAHGSVGIVRASGRAIQASDGVFQSSPGTDTAKEGDRTRTIGAKRTGMDGPLGFQLFLPSLTRSQPAPGCVPFHPSLTPSDATKSAVRRSQRAIRVSTTSPSSPSADRRGSARTLCDEVPRHSTFVDSWASAVPRPHGALVAREHGAILKGPSWNRPTSPSTCFARFATRSSRSRTR